MTTTQTITPNEGETLVEFLDRCGDDLSVLSPSLIEWLGEAVTYERPNLATQVAIRTPEGAREWVLTSPIAENATEADIEASVASLLAPAEDDDENTFYRWVAELFAADQSGDSSPFDRVLAALPSDRREFYLLALRAEVQPYTATIEDRDKYSDSVTGAEHTGACVVVTPTNPHDKLPVPMVLSPDTVALLHQSLSGEGVGR